MAESFNVWPSGVPTSYSGESFPLPKTESLPALYGVDLTNPFFLSFLIGAAFVAFFSIARFNRRSRDPTDPVTAESKLLERLTPMDLRDRRLIIQAYMLYASVLLFIYASLTFYGRFILDWVNNVLPAAGYTDTSNFNYSSPQWPLFVALAMVGVMPVLPPVEAVEVRLRHWTHRVVGIPLTIYRHSEALRAQLRRDRGVAPGAWPSYEGDVPAWVRDVADPISISYAFEARDDLWKLAGWVMTGRGEWPSGEAHRAVEALFDEGAAAAREAILSFDEQVVKKNARLSRPPAGVAMAEHHARQLNELRTAWDQASRRVIEARDGLLALLAVGAEKESDYRKIQSADLRKLLTEAIPVDGIQRGPQVSVALLLPLLLLAFGFAIRFGWHAPSIGSSPDSFSVVVISALYDVLQIAALFLLPLMAALNYRFWRRQAFRGHWQALRVLDFEQRGMVQVLFAGVLAFVVSAAGLGFLAVAQAGILARSSGHFRRLLLDQNLPLLPVAVSLAGVSVIYCLMVLFAVEEKQAGARAPKLAGMGLLCALLILGYQLLHMGFWYGAPIFFAGARFYQGGQFEDFARYYNLTSLGINTLIGFLSIACFLPDRRIGEPEPPASPPGEPSASGLKPYFAPLLFGVVLTMAATAALGSGPAATVGDGRQPVVVGFRADAPPFSSVKRIGREERFEGYLVDLCIKIFAPDRQERYRMVKTEVTAEDRFERLLLEEADRWQAGAATRGAKVDVLCDPVTLRYTTEVRDRSGPSRTDGIFSPIVYVTGVSYLERSVAGTGPAVLGFVGSTTTRKVVLQACERDAFRRRSEAGTQSDAPSIARCQRDLTRAELRLLRQERLARQAADEGRPARLPRDPVCTLGEDYRFCIFFDHTALADWFCAAKADEAKYYFGDKDLILGQVEALGKEGKCDRVNSDAPFYSYEPYALVISPVDTDLVRFVQRRIYEIFSDRSEALAMFAGNFEGKSMSVPLANLFLLNGVEDEIALPRPSATPDTCRRCSPSQPLARELAAEAPQQSPSE